MTRRCSVSDCSLTTSFNLSLKPVSIGDVIKMGLHDFDEVEGLTLEPSAFQIFHGGNSTFINSPTDAVPQFLEKLEIYMTVALLCDWQSN